MSRRLQVAGSIALLLAAVAGVYAQTAGFVNLRLDDWGYTAGCPFVRDGFSLANVGRAFADPGNGAIWMPLTYVSYMLDISLWGGGWGPHHLANVGLHGLNAVLLFLLLLRLLPRFGCAAGGRIVGCALAAALLWALHPTCVEPVAWIAARKELLWTTFALLALFPWLRYLDGGRRRDWWLTFGLFVLACLSKPTALCFPFLAMAVHRFGVPESRQRLRPYAGLLAVSVLVGLLTVFSQTNPTGFDQIDIYDTTVGWRTLNAAVSLGLCLWHTVVPTGIHFDYRAVFEGWPLDGGLGLSVLAVAFLTVVAFGLYRPRGRRLMTLTVCGWLLPLVPALGIFGIVGDHAFADRYAYLPTAVLALPLAVGFCRASMRLHPAAVGAFAGLLMVGETVVTVSLARTFRDDVAVFSRVLAKDPNHWRALEYLGSEYCARLGRMDEGVAMLRRSLRLSPRPSSAATLAYVLALRGAPGDFDEVRRLGSKVAAKPKLDRSGMMLDGLGVVAMREGDDQAAARLFSAALVAPRRAHANVHSLLNLGLCLANTGKDHDALAVLAKLATSKDSDVRRRAAEAIKAVSGNEPYARFPWK